MPLDSTKENPYKALVLFWERLWGPELGQWEYREVESQSYLGLELD